MANIRETGRGFKAQNIFNMDETGLNWKDTPDQSLGTAQHSGGKKDKARIIAVMCINATGTDHIPIWYIRKAA
jgi:hypothetical protein